MRLIRRDAYTTTRWRNGGGVTHEAVRVPAATDEYLWRLSIAEIAESGPFSDFSGYRRHMLLLGGRGVELRFANGERRLLREVGDLVEFDGGLRTDCELLAGPCTDLNLMTAPPIAAVGARVLDVREPLELRHRAGDTSLIFCMHGALQVREGELLQELGPWDLGILDRAAVVSAATPRLRDSRAFIVTLGAISPALPTEIPHA
ncbi:MAG: hypothetical protein HKM03_10845 [Steroidobacteraceae bacterium]|nr:hypothetical protein [Steroidobacteraceae bacterium]